MLPICGAESKHGRSAAPAPAAPFLPAAPASARPTPRSALSSGERLCPRPRGGWITAPPRGPRVLGDGTWIYIRAGAASARARPFYLAPDATAKGRRAKPFIFQPKNKCTEINTPLQLGGPGSGGRRREGEQSRSRAAAAGTPGPQQPGADLAAPARSGAPGTAGCRAVPRHPYPGSGTRLLPPLSAFVSPPPPARCGPAEGWAGEATAPRQPRPGSGSPPPPEGGQRAGRRSRRAHRALPPAAAKENDGATHRACGAGGGRPGPCAPTPPVTQRRVPLGRLRLPGRRSAGAPAAAAGPGDAAGRSRALRPALPARGYPATPPPEGPEPPRDGELGGGARLGVCPVGALAHPCNC